MYHRETDLCLYSECQLCLGVTSFLIVVSPVSTRSLMHAYVQRVIVQRFDVCPAQCGADSAVSSVTRTSANTHARFSKDTCRCSIAANYRVYVKNMFLITGSTHRVRTQARHTRMCMRGHVAWPYIALMSQCCTSF